MNETAAKEWLTKAWHHYSSAKVLFNAKHYTDVIAVDLHYAVEIILKSFLAFENKKIIKSHDLLEIANLVKSYVTFDEQTNSLLDTVTSYHIKGSYPAPDRKMPSNDEIKEVLDFTDNLYYKVCKILNIDAESLK
jgi:HEPN domain-containing protein